MNPVQASLVNIRVRVRPVNSRFGEDCGKGSREVGKDEGERGTRAVGGGILALAANGEPAILVLQMNRQNFSPSLHRQTKFEVCTPGCVNGPVS